MLISKKYLSQCLEQLALSTNYNRSVSHQGHRPQSESCHSNYMASN